MTARRRPASVDRATARDRAELELLAEQAFEAHAAMVRAESATPALAGNPYWRALRDTAFARFSAVYGKATPS